VAQPALQGSSTAKGGRPGVPGGRRPGIVWFRSDLRLDDNEALTRATAECSGVLPVYCFDPRDYGRSPQGYDRTGPYRASFLLQAVEDLRERLRAAGSELVVRIGKPEEVVTELARRVGAAAVYCHTEVTYEEQQVESRVAEAVKAAGVKFQTFWTNTLHHLDDLPFALASMPQNFDKFRAKVADVVARGALPAPEQVRGLPLGSSTIDAGELPTLKELGLQAAPKGATISQTCKGGESEAQKQLQTFLASAMKPPGQKAAPTAGAAHASSFSASVAPWLATGCLSPRRMLQEAMAIVNQATGTNATTSSSSGGSGMQWIEFELLWRDFFRLLTRRHSEVVLPRAQQAVKEAAAAAPAMAMA